MTAMAIARHSSGDLEDIESVVSARIGSVLEKKWRLDAVLGVGGMGAVYAATHRNGHRVAIKVLHARHCSDRTLAARLEQEACVANAIDHPGAVRIYDDGRTEDGAVFLIMELLDGEGLHARLARLEGTLPPAEALTITHGILDVLVAAHQAGILHGDVKPENVFVTRSGEVKLLDFGVTGIFPAGRGASSHDLFGTPGFMAPEQALGQVEKMDARTDLWAVGATLHRMLTGRPVHDAPSLIERLVDAGTKPVPAFATFQVGVDPDLAALLERALAFERANRFADAVQMQEAVRQCALACVWAPPPVDSVSGEIVVASPPRKSGEPTLRIYRRTRGGKKLLMLAGGAAMVAVTMLPFVDPTTSRSARQADRAAARIIGAPADPGGFPSARAAQRLIKLTPLTRAVAPPATSTVTATPAAPTTGAAKATRSGRRAKVRRNRPATSVAANDDLWGRRH